jgi:glycosyltransferase involved in cell wall biosynthesis
MKLCFLADVRSIHTKKWVEYFAKEHEIDLITLNYPKKERIGLPEEVYEKMNVRVYKISKKMPFLLFAPFKIRRLIKKIKPDLVHAHYVTQYGFCGAFSGFHPFVISAWGSDVLVDPHKSKILKLMVKFALKKGDLIICDGYHIKRPLIELGAKAQKIRLVYFGTDTKKFKPEERSEKLREMLSIFNSPAVISLRGLKPIYDVGSLIASASLVLKEIPKAKFIIAGKGSEENRLKDLAKSLGILDSVKFVGLIPNNELPQYLSSMDVYVSTSLSDAGLAASTAEAMACGLPVVITDFGDNKKWVEDGVSGFIVPLKDPESLAEKIIYLLKNEDVRKEFGMRNRKIIEERNNYYKEMKKMENIYIELVERYKT